MKLHLTKCAKRRKDERKSNNYFLIHFYFT